MVIECELCNFSVNDSIVSCIVSEGAIKVSRCTRSILICLGDCETRRFPQGMTFGSTVPEIFYFVGASAVAKDGLIVCVSRKNDRCGGICYYLPYFDAAVAKLIIQVGDDRSSRFGIYL